MRVLILSCSTGGGHNSCAAAISEVFNKYGHFCETKDSLSFVSDGFADFMSKGHSLLYRRFPSLFKNGYNFAEEHPNVLKDDSAAYKVLTKGAERLRSFLAEGNYDAVICVHVFSGMILREALSGQDKLKPKTAFLATDYTCSPGVEAFDYDMVFIPDESLREEFILRGIPEERIIPTGIPVRKTFLESAGKAEAKLHCGIVPEHRHLLVMCGSMGCGPFEKIISCLSENLPEDIEITAVCGNNEKLRNKLYETYKTSENIHILGFAGDVSLLMESADLFLTKPGGISTTEACVKALPMVFVDAVAGCEEYNLRYFLSAGGAFSADTPEKIAEKCLSLLSDGEKLGEMAKALERLRKPSASGEIYLNIGGET